MQRVFSVYLPTWPIDRIRRTMQRAERPEVGSDSAILLVTTDRNRRIVACCCPRAAAFGVQSGMTLVHARALIRSGDVFEAEHEPQRDEAALTALASWAVRFSPLVAPDPPDGILLDVRGCAHLYGGESRMLDAIGSALERLGFAGRVCCAGSIGCAWAVARYGGRRRSIVAAGEARSAIVGLPVASLRIDAATTAALHEVNIDRVGELLAVPRRALAARFDPDLLLRVDQALGEAFEGIEPIRPREPLVAERVFDGPVVHLEALLITGRELVAELASALAKIESGATTLELTCVRVDATPIRHVLRFSRPSRDVVHLWSLLCPRIESVNMGYGIERVTLIAAATHRIFHEQSEQWNTSRRQHVLIDRAAGELVDTLTDRLGASRTLRMGVVESHRPERSAVRFPSMTFDAARRRAESALVVNDRPSLLLESPAPIEVTALTPEGLPVQLRWRGEQCCLVRSIGPERISAEWWAMASRHGDGDGRAADRDYFKVQDDGGRWLWVFRDAGSGRWFVHGQWV